MAQIVLQRVYAFSGPAPQHAFLIDRLWPRGVSKQRLTGVQWLKEIAPDTALRQWFHHHPEQWDSFVEQYRRQLAENGAWQPLVALLRHGEPLTLLYGSKDAQHNHAVVLRDFLLQQLQQ
ncbi:MarR family transcriptional regulator [Gibbsiella quercinecans]|uniref:DUF488 domain-containing protein n=1 Tax=Gibbsiella quercinecans TaxID=929813 RepID=UPI000EF205C5|nr:DUF488 family protein [Gibbsiella quercinecans]RLM13754.1 MarR family transcriptional regulator [Gibbsiella quercinecans]